MVRIATLVIFFVTAPVAVWVPLNNPLTFKHKSGIYPGSTASLMTFLALVGCLVILALVLYGDSREIKAAFWWSIGAPALVLTVWCCVSLLNGSPYEVGFDDRGFMKENYKNEGAEVLLFNRSARAVTFCFGRSGVCDQSIRISSPLDAPGSVISPDHYLILPFPNETESYPITISSRDSKFIRVDTVLRTEYESPPTGGGR
ncbi:hypothetical protein [Frankia tisae]|uniref:hypothetical protein n=1 Tax=Frankia tisae TaxID=2950104 RepID=UPI0021BE5E0B|nr:hypothetical protein [Frankia tisae]